MLLHLFHAAFLAARTLDLEHVKSLWQRGLLKGGFYSRHGASELFDGDTIAVDDFNANNLAVGNAADAR